jgi:hypothetical protein
MPMLSFIISKIKPAALSSRIIFGLLLLWGIANECPLYESVAQAQAQRAAARAATVILDDSAFYENMPKGTIITQAGARGSGGSSSSPAEGAEQPQGATPQQAPGRTAQGGLPPGSWLYNNSGLVMRSQAFLYARADIQQSGTYYLFVRSHGSPATSFRVTVGERQPTVVFGNEPLKWKAGGTFELKKGTVDVVLSRVVLGPSAGSTFDVLVLTRNAEFEEEDLKQMELPEDVVLLKEYTIPRSSAVKFGDVDGDGKTDFFVLDSNYAGRMFNHQGRELWSYENEAQGARERAGFEAPGLVWDFDADGFAEVVHYQLTGGREWLVVSDGRTGAVRAKTEWPTRPMPHEYNNFRLAVARLGGAYPSHLLVFTDSGGEISVTAYTKELKQLWQHLERREKDHLGHYVYAVDLNKDGIDEVVTSPPLVLDAAGRVLWSRFDLFDDNHEHCDSFRFADLDGDGQLEMLAPLSEAGVVVFSARDGAVVWRHAAEHAQQLEVGQFLRYIRGPNIAVNGRTYARNGEAGLAAQVFWFDQRGDLISKWPANPLNGNPDFVKGDWNGDGREELFWYKFRMAEDGRGVLYFKQDVYHMFDFMGTGTEQVIARGAGVLQVYGSRLARKRAGVKRDFNYWKRVANHTHY